MIADFPESPADSQEYEFEGRTWKFDSARNQWVCAFSGTGTTSLEDIGFEYNVQEENWHLDVGRMASA